MHINYPLQLLLGLLTTAGPTVYLDDATVTGKVSSLAIHTSSWVFLMPNRRNRRFRLPEPIEPYNGYISADEYGLSCPQQASGLQYLNFLDARLRSELEKTVFGSKLADSEDCLTINVVKPASATPSSKLPVVVWMHDGLFQLGGSSLTDGSLIVDRSGDLKSDVIYVKRAALRWVQKYIGAFGGDPDKVTLWGGSSGAISASLQMVTNGGDTEGLFRAAVMQSGGPISIGDFEDGQQYFDGLVDETGCSSSSDTLDCLRNVPYDTLKMAINNSPKILNYQSLNLAWRPRVDGVFLTENPQQSILKGEGIPDDQADLLLKYYPDDQRAGSPFDTGLKNVLSTQFKRTAAILTDAFFQAPRRFFLKHTSDTQPRWAFTSKRVKTTPFIGSFIGSDISNSYGDALRDYIIRFVVNLDPNGKLGMGIPWPQYNTNKPQVVVFQDSSLFPMVLLGDTYRSQQMDFMTNLTLLYPL
ncbi:hypothetical protein H0H93_005032 [Arthromyces matolae]|nr:hypothetical protein H0H93_005032 [Arthromyces matolae]